jgi:hypothetical protein
MSALDFFGFRAFFASHNVEDNLVALVQRFESLPEYSGVMNKYILARFLGDETQALFVVPPFNFAFSHNYLLNPFEGRRTHKTTDTHLTWWRPRLALEPHTPQNWAQNNGGRTLRQALFDNVATAILTDGHRRDRRLLIIAIQKVESAAATC